MNRISLCQFCMKKDWDILIECHGSVLGNTHKYLCCKNCFDTKIYRRLRGYWKKIGVRE
jgi:hypothetical protein